MLYYKKNYSKLLTNENLRGKNMKEKGYGLFTTIAMIIGVVIGSGIFFKSDNILVATNGSIALFFLLFS